MFTSKRTFSMDSSLIPAAAEEVAAKFREEGFEVKSENLFSGDAAISITKGGVFKAIVGLKTALNISIKQENGLISAEATVGIFGQQIIPTAIGLLVFWPVFLPQAWGLIQQSRLDNHAMDLIDAALQKLQVTGCPKRQSKFCPACGAQAEGKFCSACGAKL